MKFTLILLDSAQAYFPAKFYNMMGKSKNSVTKLNLFDVLEGDQIHSKSQETLQPMNKPKWNRVNSLPPVFRSLLEGL